MRKANHIYGIEITEVSNQLVYYLVVLKINTAKELSVLDVFQKSTLDEIIAEIPKHNEVSLAFNTSAVLVKSLENKELNEGPEEAFPQLDFESFYMEEILLEEERIISLCRKQEVENILEVLKKNKLYLTNLNLGYAVLGAVNDFLKKGKPIVINNKAFEITPACIQVTEADGNNKQQLNLEGESIDASKLIAFSSAYQSITSRLTNINNYNNLVEVQKKEAKEQKNFNLLLKAGIASLLLLFLFNFMAYSYYFSKVKDIDTNQFKQMLSLQDRLSTSVDSLNNIYRQAQTNSVSKATYYLDQIIEIAPNQISINEFTFQPETRPYNEDKNQLYLEKNKIHIEAEVSNEMDFEVWIARLNQLAFIQKTEVQNYNKEGSERYHTINFSISVKE